MTRTGYVLPSVIHDPGPGAAAASAAPAGSRSGSWPQVEQANRADAAAGSAKSPTRGPHPRVRPRAALRITRGQKWHIGQALRGRTVYEGPREAGTGDVVAEFLVVWTGSASSAWLDQQTPTAKRAGWRALERDKAGRGRRPGLPRRPRGQRIDSRNREIIRASSGPSLTSTNPPRLPDSDRTA